MRSADLLEAALSIIASPRIEEFKIGVTVRPRVRKAQYRRVGFDHLVVLETGLSAGEALALEKGLQEALCADKRSLGYRKFRSTRRDEHHRASLGGRQMSDERRHVVYIAWISKG